LQEETALKIGNEAKRQLSKPAARMYEKLLYEQLQEHGCPITLTVTDAKKIGIRSHHTLAKARKELEQKGFIKATWIDNRFGYIYEVYQRDLAPSEKRAQLIRTLNALGIGRVRHYSKDDVRRVAEFLLGSPTDNGDELLFDCPFCGSKETFLVTVSKHMWVCRNKECFRSGKPTGYSGAGKIDQLPAAIKLYRDQKRTNSRTGLLMIPAHSREVIEQVLDGRTTKLEGLTYTVVGNGDKVGPLLERLSFVDDQPHRPLPVIKRNPVPSVTIEMQTS
jgi:hypothetical protein